MARLSRLGKRDYSRRRASVNDGNLFEGSDSLSLKPLSGVAAVSTTLPMT